MEFWTVVVNGLVDQGPGRRKIGKSETRKYGKENIGGKFGKIIKVTFVSSNQITFLTVKEG